MNREQLVEKAAKAMCEAGGGDWPFCNGVEAHRSEAAAAVDAVLPQITTADQLEALPDDKWVIGKDLAGKPQFWRRGEMDRPNLYLTAFGPFTVWQPS